MYTSWSAHLHVKMSAPQHRKSYLHPWVVMVPQSLPGLGYDSTAPCGHRYDSCSSSQLYLGWIVMATLIIFTIIIPWPGII